MQNEKRTFFLNMKEIGKEKKLIGEKKVHKDTMPLICGCRSDHTSRTTLSHEQILFTVNAA